MPRACNTEKDVRVREWERERMCVFLYTFLRCIGVFACDCTKEIYEKCRCLGGGGGGVVCCGCGKQWSIFSHYPTAYVWFIYIHGYPDNEAFNPGDPVVRTMNPITSCRLWDGMADSETDGRGCTRPAIQSHSSRSLPVSPVHVFCGNLSRGRGQRTWDHYITRQQPRQTHTRTHSLASTRPPQLPQAKLRLPPPPTFT